MKLNRLALAALTCCSLALGACEPKRIAVAIKPPPEKLVCIATADRPAIAPEYVIDWDKVTTVEQARSEHAAYVVSVRSREGVVAGYIVKIEGQLFACGNNAAWLTDFYKGMPDK